MVNAPTASPRRRRVVWLLLAAAVVAAVLAFTVQTMRAPDPYSKYDGSIAGSTQASSDFMRGATGTPDSQVEAFCRRAAAFPNKDPERQDVDEADYLAACTSAYAETRQCLLDGRAPIVCLEAAQEPFPG